MVKIKAKLVKRGDGVALAVKKGFADSVGLKLDEEYEVDLLGKKLNIILFLH